MNIIKFFLYLILVFLLTGCKNVPHSQLNSILWVQTASEYKANSIQTYQSAEQHLQFAIDDKSWTAALEQIDDYTDLPPAIIFDIDETILDNSAYLAQLIVDSAEYNPKTWDNWVSKKQAKAIPGAVKFINALHNRGVAGIYITNRKCHIRNGVDSVCPQKNDTIKNIRKIGIKHVIKDNVLLKHEMDNWGSEKQNRREFISRRYRILMIFGDDLGDFIPNVKKNIAYLKRNKLIDVYKEKLGKQWFILPNPIYGSWERILNSPKEQYLRTY